MTTYTFAPVCDALVELLITLPELTAVTIHRYCPWDTRTPDDLGLHLAVYPTGETYGMDRATYSDVPIESLGLIQGYTLELWQATEEGERATAAESGMRDLLDLIDEVRSLFLLPDTDTLGGCLSLRWVQARVGMTGRVRWAKVEVQATLVLA